MKTLHHNFVSLGSELPVLSPLPDTASLSYRDSLHHNSNAMIPSVQRHSCVSCAGRKVRCDRRKPCSNCSRRRSECVYESPAHSQRHRPRPSSDALLSKISEYESILRKNSIKFQPLDNQWISSPLEEKLGAPTPGTEKVLGSQPQEEHPPADLTHMQSHTVHPWFDLPEEVWLLLTHYSASSNRHESSATSQSSSSNDLNK